MAKRTCASCGCAYLRGVRAQLLVGGTARSAIVCQGCAATGVLVVASGDGRTVPATCEHCSKSPATFCRACVAGMVGLQAELDRDLPKPRKRGRS